MKMQWIKEQVEKGNYQLKLHAVERASIRGIDPIEVKEGIAVSFMGRPRLEKIFMCYVVRPMIYYG